MHEVVNASLEDWSKQYTGPKFHAVLCDPPYGLEFMGKEWDKFDAKPRKVAGTGGTQAPFAHHSVKLTPARNSQYEEQVTAWGNTLMPHLLPGALVLMFGGTRTWHRLAVGMEDAGFQMWDTLMWLYGQGFPKAQDISKLIDKKNGNTREVIGHVDVGPDIRADNYKNSHDRGRMIAEITKPSDASAAWAGHKTTALKPAWEPILAFRVPSKETYADLALTHGSGCLNIDGTRISLTEGDDPRLGGKGDWGTSQAAKNVYEGGYAGERIGSSTLGRFPANLLLDEESAAQLDEQSGVTTSGAMKREVPAYAGESVTKLLRGRSGPSNQHGDTGGASRFFYCAKASGKERNAGCETLPQKGVEEVSEKHPGDLYGERSGRNNNGNWAGMTGTPRGNHHPTVKPLALTEYLAKLLLPPNSVKPRRLLVPFAGSGSEMIGALNAGWDEVTGIEREPEYCQIAEARLAHATKDK